MHPGVADLVAARRLAEGDGVRSTFTVAKTAALLALRKTDLGGPWHWTLELVRAANALSDEAMVQVRQHTRPRDEELGRVVELDFTVPGADFHGLELRDFLAGALDADRGTPLREQLAPSQKLARWRARCATAFNGAMAGEARRITLETPVGGRRYSWRADVAPGADPFRPEIVGGLENDQRFLVRLELPAPSVGRRFGDWLSGRWDVAAVLGDLWHQRVVGSEGDRPDRGMGLAAKGLDAGVDLGTHARFTGAGGAEGLWLVRDGIAVLRLDRVPRSQLGGVPGGYVECPAVRLTADRKDVARDSAWALLVAWLHDMLAHTHDGGDGPYAYLRWPESLEGAALASGFVLSRDALQKRVRSGRDLLYVWNHQRESVPEGIRSRVLALWPSELELLRHQVPQGRLVPLSALGERPQFDPIDLTSLAQGSLDPLTLCVEARWASNEGDAFSIDVLAYVHRYAGARSGRTILLAYERQIAVLQGAEHVLPGLSLVVRVDAADGTELDIDAVRRDSKVIDGLGRHARGLAADNHEQLLGHLQHADERGFDPWQNPLFRAALDQMSPVSLGMRYETTDAGLRLAWRPSTALELKVASAQKGGVRRRLSTLLERSRDVGLVVLAAQRGRWRTLESSDPRLEPLEVDADAGGLLQRVFGSQVMMGMPAVPERHPLVAPAAQQRHLLVDKRQVERELARSTRDEDARLRLIGHLLVARVLGEDEIGLGTVPLFPRYDPRALQASTWVSLDSIAAERPAPGITFPGAATRELAGPVLELPPGPAALMHEALGLTGEAGVAPRAASSLVAGRGVGTAKRRATAGPPLVNLPVMHPDCFGSLQIASDGSSHGVSLWLEGLEIGKIELPEPLGRVSGRLWLRHPRDPARLRPEVQGMARDLLAVLVRQRLLTAPDSDRRAKLDAFIDYARTVVAERGDPLALASILGTDDRPAPVVESALDQSLRNWPLRKLTTSPDGWLHEIVIQSIGLSLEIKTAMLSWSAVKLSQASKGGYKLELGLRNAWIHRALYPERTDKGALVNRQAAGMDAFVASSVVVAEYFRQAEAAGFIAANDSHRTVAQWRLLALMFENL